MKKLGCCVACGRPCYEILEVDESGTPVRVGRMLDCGTQVVLLLSNGSHAAITACVDCADTTPLPEMWDACRDAAVRELEGRPIETRRRLMAPFSGAVYPIARLYRRREDPTGQQELVIDDRRSHGDT